MLFPSVRWQIGPGRETNLLLAARHTPCRIEGRLRDEKGRLLLNGYAAAWTSVAGTNFQTLFALEAGGSGQCGER